MDDELKECFVKLEGKIDDKIDDLREQTMINCSKLDKMDAKLDEQTKKLDGIIEIVSANGQGIEVISKRVDKLEK